MDIAFEISTISVRKCIVDMIVLSNVTCTQENVITCGHLIFSSSGQSPGRAIVLPPASALASAAGLAKC